tara:strand:- start:236 stop:856 length:621 start_codon:yes stop_codon:yes gene_type:complete
MFLELTKDSALPDREIEIKISPLHYVNNREVSNNYPSGAEKIFLGLGCFWGAERLFWQQPFVHVTSVGYGGGFTKNPTYQDLCSGQTGHAELVQIVFDKGEDTFKKILKVFWESHDPTQGMRQGNDIGTQYRSCIYVENEKFLQIAKRSLKSFQEILNKNNFGAEITTEISIDKEFFYAEDYHQQYLAKNPDGYCGIKGVGVEFEE